MEVFRATVYTCLTLTATAQLTLVFNGSDVLHETDSFSYVNYNIDTGSLYNGMDFRDPKFRALTTQLGPAYIRIGGTAVDESFYFPDAPYLIGQQNPCATCGSGASAIGTAMLTEVFDFIIATNMTLLWDLNGEYTRNAQNQWNPAVNATPMFTWIQQAYGGRINFAYSVGNEPDLWKVKVSNAQLSKDAVTLQHTLAGFDIGHDVFGSSWAHIAADEASAFLPIAAQAGLTGFTAHNYPYGGHDCNITNYLDKTKVTTNLVQSLGAVRDVKKQTPGAAGVLLVLEETACSSGGGCENVTDRFIAGFSWMLTLSAVGYSGWDRVHRQDIAGWSFAFGQSHYMLVGPAGWTNGSSELLTPHPDWFTTILFRQLVGRRVLHTLVDGPAAQTDAFDAHMWCASDAAPGGRGGVVLAWVNLSPDDAALALTPDLAAAPAVEFTLTATATGTTLADLQQDTAFLNGALLTVGEDGMLPVYPLPGKAVPPAKTFVAKGFSYGLLVFQGAWPGCL